MKHLVSVIITTKNEEKFIERLLKSVTSQTYKKLEILVIDNKSADKTKQLAKKYTSNVFNKGPERSAQRNFGVKKSSGKYILILDADMQLEKNVIAQCVEKIESDSRIGAITIPEKPIAHTFWEKVKKHEREFYNLEGDDLVEAARFFPRKVFMEVGGYDTDITGPEDWELPEKIYDLGWKNARIKAKIRHREKIPNLWSLLRKKYYYGLKSHVYLEKRKVPLLSPKTVYFLRPVFYKHWRRLLSYPLLSLAMLIMLLSEQIAGGIGFLVGKINRQ